MYKSKKLTAIADQLVSLVVRSASVGDWPTVRKHEERLLRCRSLIALSQTPGF